MRADMSGRSAAEMDDSQELPELPVSLPTTTPEHITGGQVFIAVTFLFSQTNVGGGF